MIANALNDKPLPVYGEGINVRTGSMSKTTAKPLILLSTKDVLAKSITLVVITRCGISTS